MDQVNQSKANDLSAQVSQSDPVGQVGQGDVSGGVSPVVQAQAAAGLVAADQHQVQQAPQSVVNNQPVTNSGGVTQGLGQLAGQDQGGLQQPQVLDSGGAVQPTNTSAQPPADEVGLPNKEAEPLGPSENVPLVEVKEDHEMEPEVEGWLEKLEQGHEVKLPEAVEHDGEVVVADAGAQLVEEKIVLPVTEDQMNKGLHAKVTSGARWLAEWGKRLMKMFGDQVQYKGS